MTLLSLTLHVLSFGLIGWLLFQNYKLNKRISTSLGSVDDTGSLEETIKNYFDKLNTTAEKLNNLKKSYVHLSEIASKSFQKMAIVRFNPFQHTGGDHSFALALLDNHNSGMIMTAIHSREGTRVYLKPVAYGQSELSLSKEEIAALKEASNK